MPKAAAELAALAAGAADDAAGILGFQIALLEDDALSAPAFAAIEGGAPADVAWREALDNEIGGYPPPQDQTVRAPPPRLSDPRDLPLWRLYGLPRRPTPPPPS